MRSQLSHLPEVTVVIPVWDNYCRLLPECLESVLAQQGRPSQVLVVDNASAVPLPRLPQSVAAVRAPERLSVGGARNLGLTRVTTPFVLFFDADDLMLPGTLDHLLGRLRAQPEAVATVCPYLVWDPESGTRQRLDRMPRPIVFRVSRYPRLFAFSNLLFNSFAVAGGLYRTRAVVDAGGFGDGNLGEDWIFGTALSFRGRIDFSRRPGFLRRTVEGSLWYRPHSRTELELLYRSLRERIAGDAGVAWWARASLPLLERFHRREIRRRAPEGFLHPGVPPTR